MGQLELRCLSVPGGWQTYIQHTEVTFGPVFNKITDLWAWQKTHIYSLQPARALEAA